MALTLDHASPRCCCCGSQEQRSEDQSRSIRPKTDIPFVDSRLKLGDYLGFMAMRMGFGRDRYSVRPGLYGMGKPDANSPVLVTANYKMTFDVLRSYLSGVDAWILVLDTHGVNVWCAAGKGTFGTDELVRQVEHCDIASTVSHRNLIIPQLGGPGIAAHEVKKRTGFKVNYGPIRAKDVKDYLASGMRVTPEMRQVRFPLMDRIVLAPLELVVMFKWVIALAVFMLVVSGFHGTTYFLERIVSIGIPTVAIMLLSWLGAGLLIPTLLPWLPGRMLTVKGGSIGLCFAACLGVYWWSARSPFDGFLGIAGLALLIVALAGYLGLVLTGSMPYTSLSGVKKEMRRTVPGLLAVFVVGVILWTTGRFIF